MNNGSVAKSSSLNRREFLGAGLAASLGLAVGASMVSAAPPTGPGLSVGPDGKPHPFNPRTSRAMPMRNLGKTGYQVGIFSLGCQAAVEVQGNEKLAVEIVNRALDLGVNYLDTAHSYGGGVSETHVGLVVRDRRGEAWLSTKTGRRDRDGALQQFEISLKRLQTDHVDMLQLHNVQRMEELDRIFAADGAIHAFEQAKAEGRTRFIGITGHFEPNVLLEAVHRYPFDAILMAVNAADRHYLSFIEHLLPACLEKRMGIIGMKIATRGRLVSEWVPPPADEQPERMRTSKPGTISMRESLSYNMSLPVSTNIVGVDNLGQLENNVRWASEFTPLSVAQMEALERRTLPIVRQALYFRRWDIGA